MTSSNRGSKTIIISLQIISRVVRTHASSSEVDGSTLVEVIDDVHGMTTPMAIAAHSTSTLLLLLDLLLELLLLLKISETLETHSAQASDSEARGIEAGNATDPRNTDTVWIPAHTIESKCASTTSDAELAHYGVGVLTLNSTMPGSDGYIGRDVGANSGRLMLERRKRNVRTRESGEIGGIGKSVTHDLVRSELLLEKLSLLGLKSLDLILDGDLAETNAD